MSTVAEVDVKALRAAIETEIKDAFLFTESEGFAEVQADWIAECVLDRLGLPLEEHEEGHSQAGTLSVHSSGLREPGPQ